MVVMVRMVVEVVEVEISYGEGDGETIHLHTGGAAEGQAGVLHGVSLDIIPRVKGWVNRDGLFWQ